MNGPTTGRGGPWVVAQFALMAVIAAAAALGPRWPVALRTWLVVVGIVLISGGVILAVWSARTLGRSLTPYPRPLPGGVLVATGPFSVVRHPIYTGGLALFVGVSLVSGPVALAPTAALAVLWALKSGVEERHLRARFAEYEEYSRRVRWRLVPGVY